MIRSRKARRRLVRRPRNGGGDCWLPSVRRWARFERLDERTLLAVLTVSPQPGDDPAALLAEAVSTANSTPGPDTIELSPADYDLSTLGTTPVDQAVLEISSDITIVGTSPSAVTIVPQIDRAVFAVRDGASLNLSRMTVYGSMQSSDGGLVPPHALFVDVGGVADLDQVAVVGLVDSTRFPTTLQAALIENAGTLTVSRSVLVDSSGTAIKTREASTSVVGTIIAGASLVGLASFSGQGETNGAGSLRVEDSVLFRNGLAVLSAHETLVSGSTITENGRGEVGLLNGGVLGIATAEDPPTFDLDPDNVIVGNFIHEQRNDITILSRDDVEDPIESIGTAEMAMSNLESVIAVIEDGVLSTEETLEGVNVDLVATNGQTEVKSRGLGVSSVLWNDATGMFRVDVAVPEFRGQPTVADELVALDAGRIVGGGLSVELPIHSLSATTGDLTPAQRAAWQQATIQSVTSDSGADVTVQLNGEGRLVAFEYHSLENFFGTDTLTVVAEDKDGDRLESTIAISVVQYADVTLNVAASDLDDMIDIAVSSSGFGRLSQFDLTFSYDPSVVQLVATEFGRGFPFLQETDTGIGSVSLSAFNGFSTGKDLVMVSFERVAEGPAQIELASATFTQAGNTQRLTLGAARQQYYFLSQDDTNRDGSVSASDALRVINRLADTEDATESSYDRELDTNGDRKVSPSDALRVINRIEVASSVVTEQDSTEHPVFSSDAVQHLSREEGVPAFVARPKLPLDDGTPAEFVNLTPPTQQELVSAMTVTPSADGVSIRSGLTSITTLDLYVIQPTTDRLAFGLTATDGGSNSDLTLTIWDAEGTLLDAYPTEASSGFPGGAIDVTVGEPVYFRIGSNNEDSLLYAFDTLSLT